MGSADAGGNAVPAHEVMLTQDFEIGKYEVTQAQWMSVMGSNSSHFTGLLRPVEQVSWIDVQSFLQEMNTRGDGYAYRLPTEAEWEYSVRAGTTGDYGGTGVLESDGLVLAEFERGNPPSRHEGAQRVGSVRHARERMGVGSRLVRHPVLRREPINRSGGSRHWDCPRLSRRWVELLSRAFQVRESRTPHAGDATELQLASDS